MLLFILASCQFYVNHLQLFMMVCHFVDNIYYYYMIYDV